MLRIISLLLLSVFTTQFLQAQVTLNYDGKSFGSCEVVRASLGNSGETLMLIVSEIDTDGGALESDNTELTPFYQLLLDVELPQGLPFPITAEKDNQLSINLSNLKAGMEEDAHFRSQLNASNADSMEASAAAANGQKESIEERSRAIAMQLAAGEITPAEASEAMESIAAEAESLINGMPDAPDITEIEKKANYSIVLYDTREKTQATPVSGQLTITRFTETEFVASFKGQHIVECLEVRAAASQENEAECGQMESSLVPTKRVLREGPVTFSIQLQLQEFEDFRN